jgi:CheY-like chemotaxis protein
VTKILYVEDNDDNVYMLKMRFEMLDGFEVLIAEDGEVGCQKAIAEMPDVILMDLDLPVVNGWQAAGRLKAHQKDRAKKPWRQGATSLIPNPSNLTG